MKDSKVYIYGKHAVMEAATHRPDVLKKVFLAPHVDMPDLKKKLEEQSISIATLGSKKAEGVESDAKHQGVVGLISAPKLMHPFKNFLGNLEITNDTSLVILGEVQDPHNVGAVIRSAAAFGVSGVLIPEHNQAPVTGAVIKVSAGMAFRVPLITIGNVNVAVRDLKEKGFWIYGLDGESEKSLTDEQFDAPVVFILGNESKGIREKTKEHCDVLLSIPMHEQCESLNASVSAAVALYAWSSQHKNALH